MEEASEVRHELLGGVVVAMAGTSFRHNLIHANLMFGIRADLKPGCKVVGPEQRVEVDESDGYVYPDLLVICGEPKFGPGFHALIGFHRWYSRAMLAAAARRLAQAG